MRLTKDFFQKPTLQVAQGLLGSRLIFGAYAGLITETEAYIGEDDPACHAAKGLTPRTKVMFGPAGHSYVYLIYGMYHCLNIVTEAEGFPAAVLIRGLWLESSTHLNGPGKLCKALGIATEHNNIDITHNEHFYITEGVAVGKMDVTPRIGIKQGLDRMWRFVADPREFQKC